MTPSHILLRNCEGPLDELSGFCKEACPIRTSFDGRTSVLSPGTEPGPSGSGIRQFDDSTLVAKKESIWLPALLQSPGETRIGTATSPRLEAVRWTLLLPDRALEIRPRTRPPFLHYFA